MLNISRARISQASRQSARRAKPVLALAGAAGLAAFIAANGSALQAAPTLSPFAYSQDDGSSRIAFPMGLVLVDEYTGIAAGGYDPVSYFVEGKAQPGDERLQATLGFATFQFTSAANRDAFVENPHIYMARFGGRDALAMARGRKTDGNPLVWALYHDRLFYFHSTYSRLEWLKAPAKYTKDAEKIWAKRFAPGD